MCRVLLLDDDLSYGTDLADAIKSKVSQGYQIEVADQISEAIKKTCQAVHQEQPYDIFLIDQRLGPGPEGIEVMQDLKRISPQSDAIIFTGWESQEDGIKAYKAGAYQYLPKPFDPEELCLLLEQLDSWRKLQRERSWLHVFVETEEQILNCTSYQQAAQTVVEGALNLGFQRVLLFSQHPLGGKHLVGVSQAGKNRLKGFEKERFLITDDPYLSQALHLQDVIIFNERKHGTGVFDRKYGKGYIPPSGEWAVLPLRLGGQQVGILMLESFTSEHHIRGEGRRLLQLFSRLVAGSLERTRLDEQTRADAQRLDLLQRASAELLSIADQDEEGFWLTLLTLATASYGLSFNRAWIFLAEAGNTRLRGKLGVGHMENKRARKDWELDEAECLDFEGFLARLRAGTVRHTPLEEMSRDFVVNLDDPDSAFLQVLESGKRIMLSSDMLTKHLPVEFQQRFAPGACGVVPLRAGQATIGILVVDNKHDDKPIYQDALDRLETFSNIAGLAWQNHRQRVQREALLDATYAIMGKVNLQPLGETLRRVCEAARTVTCADWAIIYPLQPGGEPYEYDVQNIGYTGAVDFNNIRSKPSPKGVSAHILHSGTLVVEDVQKGDYVTGRDLNTHHFILSEGIRALIGTPVSSIERDEKLGILYLDYRTVQRFGEVDIRQAEWFANLASIAMLNARYTEKVRDSLSITQETTAAIGTTPDLNQLLRTVFSNLQESFPDAIPCVLTYNEDDNLLEFAPASLEFYRIESPEYEGLRILHLNGSSIACRVARQSLRTQKIEVENVGNVSEDADYLPVNPTTQAELCASLFSGGRLLGVIVLESSHQNGFAKDDEALILNLARQISLAIERVQQNAQLKFTQAVAQATAWAADVAHDLNREVGVIRKCAYLIHEKADQPEQVRHYVELIEKSSAQLASVGLWQPTEKPIELDPFIRRAVTKSTENRKEKIEVEFALDCAGVSIRGNPIALERVIRQLVRNAAQAMAKSAKRCLIVSTRLVEAGMVEIQFTDSGPGVDEEIRPLILHQPTSTKRDEGGYGLLLIRQMVEDMHGKIRLLPGRSDTGATFAIRLPVRENSERQDGGI